jgi:hypothetical protein
VKPELTAAVVGVVDWDNELLEDDDPLPASLVLDVVLVVVRVRVLAAAAFAWATAR